MQIKVWYQNRRTKQRKESPSCNVPVSVASEPSPPREPPKGQVPSANSVNSNVPAWDSPAIRWSPATSSYEQSVLYNQAALQYRTNIYQQFIQSYGSMPSHQQAQHHAASLANDRHQHTIF